MVRRTRTLWLALLLFSLSRCMPVLPMCGEHPAGVPADQQPDWPSCLTEVEAHLPRLVLRKVDPDYERLSYDELLRHYTALVSELEGETARYRASLPIYAKLDRRIRNVALPLMKRAELGRLRMVVESPHLSEEEGREITEKLERFDYKKAIASLISSVYVDLVKEASEIVDPDAEEAKLFEYLAMGHKDAPIVKDPLRYKIPFDKGSLEYARFYSNLTEGLPTVAGVMYRALARALPQELREKEERVRDFHELLVKKAKEERKNLPPKYVDGYEASFKGLYKEVEDLTKAFWEEKKRGDKSAQEILRELSISTTSPGTLPADESDPKGRLKFDE
jgi:hypothetical protein